MWPSLFTILTLYFFYVIIFNVLSALVAQLDRVFDYESKGRRFESCRAHHLDHSFKQKLNNLPPNLYRYILSPALAGLNFFNNLL